MPAIKLESSLSDDPYSTVEWKTTSARINDESGNAVYEQIGVEFPKSWSDQAVKVVASKYFYGPKQSREYSLKQVFDRVCDTIADWGYRDGYFEDVSDATNFSNDLKYMLVHQMFAFNSPVWFNFGITPEESNEIEDGLTNRHNWALDEHKIFKGTQDISDINQVSPYDRPQGSACFIQGVKDDLNDIMELAKSEALLFKFGSGTGTDLSSLRSSKEPLNGGGRASGPLSFLRIYDQVAAVVKSGGKTRRAAKMNTLRSNHPDIMEFIHCKHDEEQKAGKLKELGYGSSMDSESYSSVFFQNANLSVRVDDEFMNAVEMGWDYDLVGVAKKEYKETHRARDIWDEIVRCAHGCGDPGLQFDTEINRMNPIKAIDRQNTSNPCSEFLFIDDSACNLASINLVKFLEYDEFDELLHFNWRLYRRTITTLITAMDIIVDRASYPTREIALNSHWYRPLGLGYTNLGAFLMRLGLPYDSDQGRSVAEILTSVLMAQSVIASSQLSEVRGSYHRWSDTKEDYGQILQEYKANDRMIDRDIPECMQYDSQQVWVDALQSAQSKGLRNAQLTLLAPTGTISFMMDADTTGIEPDIGLVKYKSLAGGGTLKIVNNSVEYALRQLGYDENVPLILDYIAEHGHVQGCEWLNEEYLPVFDCAFAPNIPNGRSISPLGHVKMMAACQKYLSGAISKTVNMPADATIDDVKQVYFEAWRSKLKAVAIYRDGSKHAQALSLSKSDESSVPEVQVEFKDKAVQLAPVRRKPPRTFNSVIRHKLDIDGHEGYLFISRYPEGGVCEIFLKMAKEGTAISGLVDSLGIAWSVALQYGVPFETLREKYVGMKFDPCGYVMGKDGPDSPYLPVPRCTSIVDYVWRWIELNVYGLPNPHSVEEEDAVNPT